MGFGRDVDLCGQLRFVHAGRADVVGRFLWSGSTCTCLHMRGSVVRMAGAKIMESAMEVIDQLILKFFTPAMLQVPSPALQAPANWLIPLLIWTLLLRYLIALLRHEHFRWLAGKVQATIRDLGEKLNDSLTYPEVHPRREMFADLGVCILHYLFALYFFMLGFSTGLLSIATFDDHPYKIGLAQLGICLFLFFVARWYAAGGARARLSLERRWQAYPQKDLCSVAALSCAPIVSIAAALLANQIMPTWN